MAFPKRIFRVLIIVAAIAFFFSGCTVFADETSRKLSDCDRYLSSPSSYSSCYSAIAEDTAKTDPERAAGICEQMKKTIETKLRQSTSASDIYGAFSEGASSKVHNMCITKVLQAKTKK